ncbi:MAG: hypothetical protein LBR97_07895 [Dysgonamonadaceae bacterium]|jgi:hypothetical protein|nr:hypothetical protein [Dysgonamonadaceae bacterium]
MTFGDFEQYFSATRINRYLVATNHSKEKTVKLYKANLKIAQAFHPLLGIFEVVLRNNHNEPICFVGNTINFSNALEVYNSINKILTWINPKLLQLISDLDNVQKTIIIAKQT